MRFVKLATAAFAAALGMMAMSAPASAADGGDISRSYGVWRNPKNSVHLEIKDCGPSTCGVVVWASPKAEADARKSGTDTLIGKQLLRDFETQNNGSLKGRVWVPTLKVTLVGTAEIVDPKTMRAKGCVIGNFLCKSQLWTRIDAPSMLASRAAP
ncbi:DUF2147 domain-containing protein [Caulobacter segnis]|uniref:DUF2147 domain-containing protein n=2 Tax=Caulobacter segnis TaxID=88688 RepID=D5VJ46_CAUST|nr:DUF2147 domain-containing protein [Caulobacter segnis]ADG10134.1 Protein of unknown function DUF2147 [Caulobacter segnis ATCC 21756]AVQ01883.1 DUF2147 domain-containing protein [Caulobacter segnis]